MPQNNLNCFWEFIVGEPFVPWVEHLFDSLLRTYEKLKELGFTYFNGKVTVIDVEEGLNE